MPDSAPKIPSLPGTTLDELSKGKVPESIKSIFGEQPPKESKLSATSAPFVPGQGQVGKPEQSGKSRRRHHKKSKKATRKSRKTRRR